MKKFLFFMLLLLINPIYVGALGVDAVEYFRQLKQNGNTSLEYDNTIDNNLRFIGESNNYVTFGDKLDVTLYTGVNNNLAFTDDSVCHNSTGECYPHFLQDSLINWRIVGVMNNVKDENGISDSRIKLILQYAPVIFSDEGTYIEDWNSNDILSSFKNSSLLRTLNPNYEREGKSVFWTSPTDRGINGNVKSVLEYYSLTNLSKKYIDTVQWNIGVVGGNLSFNNVYDMEKKGQIWTGKVGLPLLSDAIFPSNFSYSNNGVLCSEISFDTWNFNEHRSCCFDNWLSAPYDGSKYTFSMYDSVNNWQFIRKGAQKVNLIDYEENIYSNSKGYPTIYLKPGTMITGGDGTFDNPYTLSLYEKYKTEVKMDNYNIDITSYFDSVDFSDVEWKISDESILKIKNNKIIPIKLGESNISATIGDDIFSLDVIVVDNKNISKDSNHLNDVNPETYNLVYMVIIFIVSIVVLGIFFLYFDKIFKKKS